MPVDLERQVFGAPSSKPTLLIAHGLFGSKRNWQALAKRLAADRQVVTVDMRNHGDSPWDDANSYLDMAGDLANVIDGQWDVIGHSMGGKTAMALTLTAPDKVRRAVIADIAPVAYTHTQEHLIDAMEAVNLSSIESRGQADDALAASIPEIGVRSFLLQSLDVKARRWKFNLKSLRAEMAKILNFPEFSAAFEGPVFFLSGGASDYVTADHRQTIKALFPNARAAKIPGAGHWLHAEKPEEFLAAAQAFLDA